MKRISLLAAIMVMTTIASAYNRIPYSCQIRYSPYAFGYGSTGLIPGCIQTSPYAFSTAYPSGLVPDNVRYSPYAFSTRTTGLISDLGWSCPGCWLWFEDLVRPVCDRQPCEGPKQELAQAELPYAAQAPCYAYIPGPQRKPTDRTDQARLVMDYLKNTIPGRFRISNIMSMDNQMLSFDVILEDQKVLIKYWNGPKIQSVRRRSDYKTKAWQRYMASWLDFSRMFEAAGGRICHAASEDNFELLSTVASYIKSDNG